MKSIASLCERLLAQEALLLLLLRARGRRTPTPGGFTHPLLPTSSGPNPCWPCPPPSQLISRVLRNGHGASRSLSHALDPRSSRLGDARVRALGGVPSARRRRSPRASQHLFRPLVDPNSRLVGHRHWRHPVGRVLRRNRPSLGCGLGVVGGRFSDDLGSGLGDESPDYRADRSSHPRRLLRKVPPASPLLAAQGIHE